VDINGLRQDGIVTLLIAIGPKSIGRLSQISKLKIQILSSDEAGGRLEMLGKR
jgi:hypothetical protein